MRFFPLCPLSPESSWLWLIAIPHAQTHPTLAIVELMRILIDEEDLHWDQAWTIVTNTFFFTNHTVLPVRGFSSSPRSSCSLSHAIFWFVGSARGRQSMFRTVVDADAFLRFCSCFFLSCGV